LELLPAATDLVCRPSSPYRAPGWVLDFAKNPRRLEFVGKEGSDLLAVWLAQSEVRVRELMEQRPWGLLHALALLRRLPNDRFFQGERESEGAPSHFDPYQANVAERTALKYAAWDVSGVEIEGLHPGLAGLGRDRPAISLQEVAEILALVRHASIGLAHIDNMRKNVLRGGRVILHPDGNADSRQEPGLQRRLNLYIERRQKFSLIGAGAGTFHSSDIQKGLGEKSVVRSTRHALQEDRGQERWRYETLRTSIPRWDKRFELSQVNLQPIYDHMKLLEPEVISQYGLGPEPIVAALISVSRLFDHSLSPDGTSEGLLSERLAHLDRRGYLLVNEEIMDGLVLGKWAKEAFERAFPEVTRSDDTEAYACSFKNLAYLDSYRKEDLSLVDGSPWVRRAEEDDPVPMPPPFVYPAGSHRVVDLNAVGAFVNGLFECLTLEEKPRQSVAGDLEHRFANYLDNELDNRRAFDPSKKLYVKPSGQNRRVVAELDASVGIGSVLVAIDAKSIRVSSGYRRYDYDALITRWRKFENYVDHANQQANKLARQPRGTNYDLLACGYTHVVTLLCSAMPEFIYTDVEDFYINEDLPRVATPLELRNYLAEVTEDDLKALPFAKRITGD
jgi:hypothetical protein